MGDGEGGLGPLLLYVLAWMHAWEELRCLEIHAPNPATDIYAIGIRIDARRRGIAGNGNRKRLRWRGNEQKSPISRLVMYVNVDVTRRNRKSITRGCDRITLFIFLHVRPITLHNITQYQTAVSTSPCIARRGPSPHSNSPSFHVLRSHSIRTTGSAACAARSRRWD